MYYSNELKRKVYLQWNVTEADKGVKVECLDRRILGSCCSGQG